jgi:quinol monooxygenase YgiN
MVTLTAKPGGAAALAAFWDDDIVAQITAQQGCRGFYTLTDSADDRVVLVSLWDSADDADATAPTYLAHMAAVAEQLAGPPSPAGMHVAVATTTPQALSSDLASTVPSP